MVSLCRNRAGHAFFIMGACNSGMEKSWFLNEKLFMYTNRTCCVIIVLLVIVRTFPGFEMCGFAHVHAPRRNAAQSVL